MANPLLLRMAPEVLARRKQVIESIDKLSCFGRLSEIVAKDLEALGPGQSPPDVRGTEVRTWLEFGWADAQERWPRVHGKVATRLPAVCQRCLEPCEIDLDVAVNLLLVKSRDTRSADDALEIWELEGSELLPLDLVEETLVMALPLAPKHETLADCGLQVSSQEEAPANTQEKIRPFANLKEQLKQPR
ncbi:MAG: DUF177 domain-containing protein [Woeseia sp.]